MRALQAKHKQVSTTVLNMDDFGFDEEPRNSAVRAIITSSANNAMCIWTKDDNPTATLGHPVVANGEPLIVRDRWNISHIKLVRQGSSDAEVTITLEN